MILDENGKLVCPEGQVVCNYPMGTKCGTKEEAVFAESLERIDWSKVTVVKNDWPNENYFKSRERKKEDE